MNNETINLGTTQITPSEYEILQFATLWSDIRPHCDDPAIQAVLNDIAREWIKDHGWDEDEPLKQTWDIVEALKGRCPAPWELGDACSWDMEFELRIDMGAENQEPIADAALACSHLHYLIDEVRDIDHTLVSDKEQRLIEGICTRLRDQFKPEPDSLDWWVIKRGCHYMAPFALALAQKVFPDGDWEILEGINHSTVVDEKHHRCFDMLFGDYAHETDYLNPVEFALVTCPYQSGYYN